VVGFAIERLVVTDTEAIENLLADAFRSVKSRELTRLRPLLSEDFRYRDRGPDDAVSEAVRLVERHKPTLIELSRGPIVVAAPNAEAEVDVRVFGHGGAWLGRLVLTLRKEDGTWRVLTAESEAVTPSALGLPLPGGR
jgi:hypothetical protein